MKICDRIPAIINCSSADRLHLFIATGGGTGFCPFAPGTTGTAVGLAVAWLFSLLPFAVLLPALVAITLLAVITADRAAEIMQQKDPRIVVADEIAGITFAMAWLPFTPINVAVQFLLFRILDIFKPFPANWLEKNLKGGWGIVMDDIAAGIMANLIWRAGNMLLHTSGIF